LLVRCVVQFQIKHRTSTSTCKRLSQNVRILRDSARSLHRTNIKGNRNSLVTIPTVNAENCSSSAQTHGTQTNSGGSRLKQTQFETRQEISTVSGEKKQKSWSIHSVAVSARRTDNTTVSTRNIHTQSMYRRKLVSMCNTVQDLPRLREPRILPNAIYRLYRGECARIRESVP
jgi:hypothetical protein